MSTVIDKDNPEWERLYKMWLEEGKPGWLSGANGTTYQVLQPGNDEVKFAVKGGMDVLYGSSSAPLGSRVGGKK